MARGLNKVMLLGNLGSAPDVRSSERGTSIANFSLATNESWFNKQTNEREEKTEWHRVVCFGKLADIVQQYLNKGSQVFVEGRLQTRKWTDSDGADRYTTEIVCNELRMLGGNSSSGRSDDETPPRQRERAAPKQRDVVDEIIDDDIPF